MNKRRSRRPLNIRRPVHLTLRSDLAKGHRSLLKNQAIVRRVLQRFAKRFRIQVYEFAICGNHIHCLVKAHARRELQSFFRTLAGQIPQRILQVYPLLHHEHHHPRGGTPHRLSKRRSPHPKNRRVFWSLLLWSRIVSWGRDYQAVKAYVIQNTQEALEISAYKERAARPPKKKGSS